MRNPRDKTNKVRDCKKYCSKFSIFISFELHILNQLRSKNKTK